MSSRYQKLNERKSSVPVGTNLGQRPSWETAISPEDNNSPYTTYNYEYSNRVHIGGSNNNNASSPVYEPVKRMSTSRESTSSLQGRRPKELDSEGFTLSDENLPYMNEAASKIQAGYRGYKVRRSFWKEREQARRRSESLRGTEDNVEPYNQAREPSYVPRKSYKTQAIDNRRSSKQLSADPNLGVIPELQPVDSNTKLMISKDWRTRTSTTLPVPVISQLRDEQSSVVLLLGGIDPLNPKDYELGASMFVYDVSKNKWFFAGYMPEPRNYHAAAFCNDMVYVTGGYSQFNVQNGEMVATRTVFMLNPVSKRWRKRSDMHYCRACHGLCAVNLNLFAIGGRSDGGQILAAVETYDTTVDQWTVIRSLPEPLMGMAVASLDMSIFVIGGLSKEENSTSYYVSDRVYFYDKDQLSWFGRMSLPEPLAFASATTIKREVWVWGGVEKNLNHDGTLISSDSVYAYIRSENKWHPCFNMQTPKHSMAVAKISSHVYLMGGMSSTTSEALTENDIFDKDFGQTKEGASLPKPLVGSAAVGLLPDTSKGVHADIAQQMMSSTRPVLDAAATKIQAAYRGHKTRANQMSSEEGNYDIEAPARYRKYSQLQGINLEEDFRKLNTVQVQSWPPKPSPTTSSSCVNLTLGSQYPGYTITKEDKYYKIRRYICLDPEIDPNMGLIPYLDDLYKKTRIVIGLRHIDQTPFYAVDIKNIENLRDDSVPMVLITGGVNARDPLNIPLGKAVLRYHPLKDRFYYVNLMPEARNHHAAVYLDDKVFVTGGCDPDSRNNGEMVSTKSTFCLNFHTCEWIRKCPMNCARSFHSLVVLSKTIYAIGGRDHNGRIIASIESYSVENDQWSLLRPMSVARMGLSAVAFENKIWCLGGIGASVSEGPDTPLNVLSTVASYEPSSDTWTNRPPLRCPRAFGGAVVINKRIWLCAGCCKVPGQKTLVSMASVDSYDPDEAEWQRHAIICNPRHCASVVAVEDCIYLFGGVCSQEWSDLDRNEMVITYDFSLHNLRNLPNATTGAAAVVIPPLRPTLRAESLACLVHNKLAN